MTKVKTKKTIEENLNEESTSTNPVASTSELALRAGRDLFGAFTQSGRKTITGVIEVDKVVLGFAKDALTSYLNHGKATMRAKNINELIDLQAAYAHSRIEANVANVREVIDLAKTRSQEAYAPVKEAIEDLKSGRAAA